MNDLMSTREVARLYQVTSGAVLNWIHTGKLPAYTTPGGHYRVSRADLGQFARQHGLPHAGDTPHDGLLLLFVGTDGPFFSRLRSAVRFRWPSAQMERAANEFEVGWWLARLNPTHIALHPRFTPADLSRQCEQLIGKGDSVVRLVLLPASPDDGLGEWVDRLEPAVGRRSNP